MSTYKCNRVKLISFILGDLKKESFSTVKDHISHCRTCRKFVDSYQDKQLDYLHNNPFETKVTKKNEHTQKEKFLYFPYKKPLYTLTATFIVCVVGLFFYRMFQS